jgi:site-specific recombinase XerD
MGNTPILTRIYLNSDRLAIGATGLAVQPFSWDSNEMRVKGHSAEAAKFNKALDDIQADLTHIYRKLEYMEELSLGRIKSDYLGKTSSKESIMTIFDQYIGDIKKQVGITKAKATLQKYKNCKMHIKNFLSFKYRRSDMYLSELKPLTIHDFEIYLLSEAKFCPNTATKMLKTFKTIIIFAQKSGLLDHDPFLNVRFHLEPTHRAFLTDEEVIKIMKKDFGCDRLNAVRDIFVFSCFTGLAYIDAAHLKEDNIVELDGKQWIMTQRKKTRVATNIILLDIPKEIIAKYADRRRNGYLLPMLSNQKTNSYLKEIGDICGIKKQLTFHVARHTFATMSLSKCVPIETVSKMLGHTNIKTTQIYARITNKKIENDMMELSTKLSKFDAVAEKIF